MKKLTMTFICLLSASYIYAQQAEIETIIRKLEETERQAVLKHDTATLQKVWSSDLIVNAPSNRVVLSTGRVADRPVVAMLSYSVFTREIEQLVIKDDIVFSMGNEVVVPVGDDPKAGRSVKRRYTNIWIKENGNWKLVARHANEICEQ